MPISIQPVLAEAWALFRRDRDWLMRLAAPFLFLPPFALQLLVPNWPPAPVGDDAAGREQRMLAWADLFAAWAREHGGWYILAYAFAAFGSAAVYAAYLDPRAPDIRSALARAGSLLPRYLLAVLLVAIPTGAGLFLWILPGLYVMGRFMLAGPALVAEQPLSATGAVGRAFSLSRGAGLPLMALAALLLLGGFLAAQPFALLDLRAGESRAAGALAAAGLAAVSMLTNIAQALVAVVVYRRLAAR